jgi:hypothetical protein
MVTVGQKSSECTLKRNWINLELDLFVPLKKPLCKLYGRSVCFNQVCSVSNKERQQMNVNVLLRCRELVFDGRDISGICYDMGVVLSELLACGHVDCTEGPKVHVRSFHWTCQTICSKFLNNLLLYTCIYVCVRH